MSTGGAFEIGRPINVNNFGAGTTIGGNADVASTFSGLIALNENLTVSQVQPAVGSTAALNIAGGITGSAVADTPTTVTFAGPGAINVHTTAISDGSGGGTTKTAVNVTGGAVTMSAANLYTGGTAVSGGSLLLDMAVNNLGVLASGSPIGLGGGTLSLKGQTGAGTSSQILGDPTLTAGSSNIVIDPNGGAGTALTLGNTWTRAAGAVFNVDLSAAGTPTLTSSPALTGNILSYATVKDATGTGFATVAGGNVVRYAAGSELRSNSDAAATDFTTKATDTDYAAGTLAMTNASRALNSLSIDSSAGAGTIDLGGATNVLTLTGGALLMTGANNFTIQNGQLGADGRRAGRPPDGRGHADHRRHGRRRHERPDRRTARAFWPSAARTTTQAQPMSSAVRSS